MKNGYNISPVLAAVAKPFPFPLLSSWFNLFFWPSLPARPRVCTTSLFWTHVTPPTCPRPCLRQKRLIRGKVTLGSQCFSSLSAYRCFVDVRYRSVFKVLTHGFYVLFLRLIYLLVKFSLPFIYSIIVVWGLKILCLCCKIWSNFFYPLPSYAFPSLSLIVHYILVLLLYHRWLRMKILTVCCKRWYNFLIHRFYVHSFAFFTRWLYCGLYLLYYYCLWLKILVCFKRWSYFFYPSIRYVFSRFFYALIIFRSPSTHSAFPRWANISLLWRMKILLVCCESWLRFWFIGFIYFPFAFFTHWLCSGCLLLTILSLFVDENSLLLL